MAKASNVLGLMSGTSMDGVDVGPLHTDGQDMAIAGPNSFTPYPDEVRNALRACMGLSSDPDGRVARAAELVTDWHIKAVREFQQKCAEPIELIGFHGQTIFHDPARGKTWQIGDGQKLADALGIDVIYDFRSADMKAGGQGAPLIPLYHQVLVKNLEQPVGVLNVGGVANVTWIDGNTVIACDTGPGNALIDDWMLKKTGAAIDRDGRAALAGKIDQPRIDHWLQDAYFSKRAPKSLDRNAFAACRVDDLSIEDGAATLAAFTAQSVMRALQMMPAFPKQLIVAGGGRHNQAIMNQLTHAINADDLGWSGDSLEAEGFAYLAMRSKLNLPLSLPTTTGCKTPTTGGRYARARA